MALLAYDASGPARWLGGSLCRGFGGIMGLGSVVLPPGNTFDSNMGAPEDCCRGEQKRKFRFP